MNITVLGIGMMGFPMARRLCEAGHRLTAWNRSRDKAERLTAHGALVCDTPAQATAQADMVLSLLENGQVVHEVLFNQGAAAAMKAGALVIDMASIKPREARDHAARLEKLGVQHLDAPVSGGTVGAQAGTLAIMAGGDAADFARALPVLQVLGRATHVGGHGAGQVCKLANQLVVGVTIGAVAEAMLLAEKGGASAAKFKEAVTGGFADSRILQVHGQRMIERDFAKRGSMAVHLKDMRNITDTEQELGFDGPLSQLLEQLFADGVTHGDADLDHSALFRELARRNGME
jgi:3-hydroxyisobutyrate dehydrogenase-like beta-hydroxyacid dehydrogenase